MSFANPQYLVETVWLAEHLQDPDLRILDCTTVRLVDEGSGLRVESGRETWAREHIPDSGLADLVLDLSDRNSPLRFMMPSAAQFAEAMSSYGVGPGTRVVLYDSEIGSWAARVWWMLRAFGFDDASVLNGGLHKWKREGRPISTEPPQYPRALFTALPRLELIADRDEVLGAIDQGDICIINALSEEQHRGTGGVNYGRPGRIPSSVNMPAREVVGPDTNAYLPAETLRQRFADVGATAAGRVITYCGGGIAASNDAFVLTLLGHQNVAVYDGSMSEWNADPSLPMETG